MWQKEVVWGESLLKILDIFGAFETYSVRQCMIGIIRAAIASELLFVSRYDEDFVYFPWYSVGCLCVLNIEYILTKIL